MGEKKNDGENKKKGDDGGKKKKNEGEKTTSVTVVLKVDMHCDGCASRIVKRVRGFEGVETVKLEVAASKLTVTGAVDPAKLREKLQEKTKKKVELVSPQPKKDKENANNNNNQNDKNDDKNKPKKSDDKKSDNEKKPKEPPVTTAVLKLNFHCQGCIEKIHKTVTKTKGIQEIMMDKQKQLVTVKGTMDVKKLTAKLTEKLKRPVEIVPPPPKKEKENDNDGGKKKKGGAGGGGGGQEAPAGGGGEGNKGDGANKMEYVPGQPGYGYGYGYGYGHGHGHGHAYPYQYPYGQYGYPVQAHAPQIFSDENPNACAVM